MVGAQHIINTAEVAEAVKMPKRLELAHALGMWLGNGIAPPVYR